MDLKVLNNTAALSKPHIDRQLSVEQDTHGKNSKEQSKFNYILDRLHKHKDRETMTDSEKSEDIQSVEPEKIQVPQTNRKNHDETASQKLEEMMENAPDIHSIKEDSETTLENTLQLILSQLLSKLNTGKAEESISIIEDKSSIDQGATLKEINLTSLSLLDNLLESASTLRELNNISGITENLDFSGEELGIKQIGIKQLEGLLKVEFGKRIVEVKGNERAGVIFNGGDIEDIVKAIKLSFLTLQEGHVAKKQEHKAVSVPVLGNLKDFRAKDAACNSEAVKERLAQTSESKVVIENKTSGERLLKSIISGEDDSRLNKLNVFMAQFTGNREELASVAANRDIVIHKSDMASDVIKAVKYMELNNIKEFTVKIAPKELGEVVIKLHMDGETMKASITANNKETYSLLNSSITEMRNALNNTEIKVQDVAINIYQGDSTFFKGGSEQNGQNFHQQSFVTDAKNGGVETTEDIAQESKYDENNLNILV